MDSDPIHRPTSADLTFTALQRAAGELARARELANGIGSEIPDLHALCRMRAAIGDAIAIVSQCLDELAPAVEPATLQRLTGDRSMRLRLARRASDAHDPASLTLHDAHVGAWGAWRGDLAGELARLATFNEVIRREFPL